MSPFQHQTNKVHARLILDEVEAMVAGKMSASQASDDYQQELCRAKNSNDETLRQIAAHLLSRYHEDRRARERGELTYKADPGDWVVSTDDAGRIVRLSRVVDQLPRELGYCYVCESSSEGERTAVWGRYVVEVISPCADSSTIEFYRAKKKLRDLLVEDQTAVVMAALDVLADMGASLNSEEVADLLAHPAPEVRKRALLFAADLDLEAQGPDTDTRTPDR